MTLQNNKLDNINAALNYTLVHLQGVYEEMAKATDIKSKNDNPFEDNPYAEEGGLTGRAKQIKAKAVFLDSCI